MAFSSVVKPYKFVNPSSILSKGGGATIISGGKTIAGGMTSQVKSSRVTLLSINRIGMAMESLGKTQQQIRDIIVYENKYLAQTTAFRKKKEAYKRDQKSEEKSESFGKKEQEGVAKEVTKKEKKSLGILEKIFGPFAGIISFVGRFVITQTVLRWMGDPKNTDKMATFVKSFAKVFRWAFNIAYKSTDAVLTGFAKVFGSSDKKGLDRFGEVLNGLGSLLIGIAGFKALGYLLNPFSLVNDIMGLLDMLDFGGGKTSPSTTPDTPSAKPRAAAQKVAENYGDDAARYYDDLISRGKKPGDALKAVRGRFKKIPPKPKGLLTQLGDKFTDIKKGISGGLSKAFGNFKKFGSNITKSARDNLIKSGEFIKSSTQKAMQPVAKAAYDFLEKKGIIKLANNLGEKAVGTISKMPGYSKIMAKVQKEGGQEVLKKIGGKAIPVIGGLVNLYFAYDRLKNGDKSGAALEALSAILDIAGLFTGGATSALSMVLDTYLFGRDFFPDLVKKENDAFGGLINNILGPIKGIKDNLPKLPWMAKGGLVTKPTIAGLGENGPEAVIPLSQLQSVGGAGQLAATIIGATESALSRMGAAGEIARSLIGPDLAEAAKAFGVQGIKGSGGDTLGKSVNKGGKLIEIGGEGELSGLSVLIGQDNVVIRDKKDPANKPHTLRGQLANILGALLWVSKKNLSGGGGAGGTSGGGGGADGPNSFEATEWKQDPEFATAVNSVAKHFNIRANDLLGLMASESGLRPNASNGTHVGLIQFSASSARGAGTSQQALLGMTRAQQMPYVQKYLENAGLPKGATAGHLYTAVFLPAFVQKPANFVIANKSGTQPAGYPESSRWYSSNRGLDMNNDGQLTITELGERINKKKKEFGIPMAKGGELPPPGVGRNKKEETIKPKEQSKYKILKGEAIGGLVKFAAGGAFKNGELPSSALQDIGKGHKLRKGDAAESFLQMAAAAKKDGIDLVSDITDSYRDLAGQRHMFATKPSGMAARPGTSKHGWGVALDIGYARSQNWINKKGSSFGWGLPDWAKGGFEPWHFEKLGAATGGSAGSSTDTSGSSGSSTPEEPPETMESIIEKLRSAVSGLNTSLGYTPPPTTEAGTTAKPGKTPPAPVTPTPQPVSPIKPAATLSASTSGKKVTDVSDQVARLEEAAETAGNYGQIIPLPINSGRNTQIAFSGTEVYAPRTPITYGI